MTGNANIRAVKLWTILTILLSISLFILPFSCGKENPLKPGTPPDTTENPDTTVKPDTLPPTLPKLWNLAAGASWKYRLLLDFYEEFWRPHLRSAKGTLEMTIKEANSLEGYQEYLLEEHLHIDRLIDSHMNSNFEYFLDTLYNFPDTTLQRKIISARDTLWLESGDSLVYMMQNYYGENAPINFDIFYLTIYNLFYRYPLQVLRGISNSKNTHFIYSDPYNDLTAVFDVSVGGLTSIESLYSEGVPAKVKNNFSYKLIAYTPGPGEFLKNRNNPGK